MPWQLAAYPCLGLQVTKPWSDAGHNGAIDYQSSICVIQSVFLGIMAQIDMASKLQVAFDHFGAVYTVLNKHHAPQPTEQYSASGQVEIYVEVAEALVPEIQQDMLNATSGAVQPQVVQ